MLVHPLVGYSDSSINSVNRYAYGANVGWLDFRGDDVQGAVLGQFYATGYVWSANCGWVCLGNGPTNGFAYSNTSSNDWGVNHDGLGNLRGYAYGANIGWINFEDSGNPTVNLLHGRLSGFVYGANVGWIDLSNTMAFVQTDYLSHGPDSDGDGIPDAWEYYRTGSLTNLNGGADVDGDGIPDADEYQADTDPLDETSSLEITSIERINETNHVTWTVESTRFYRLEQSESAANETSWTDAGLGVLPPGVGPTLSGIVPDPAATTRFYRAKGLVPLAP